MVRCVYLCPHYIDFPITARSITAQGLTAEDIGEFLRSIDLPQYAESFVSEGIDGETLLGLHEDDLKDLGVKKGFHRKKIQIKYKTFLENKKD